MRHTDTTTKTPELDAHVGVGPDPLFRRFGDCELWCADWRDMKMWRHIKDATAVVTDPPYGIADCWKGGFSAKHGWASAGAGKEKRNGWDEKAPTKGELEALLRIGDSACFWGGNFFDLPVSRGWLVWSKPERGFTLSEAELAWTSRDAPMRVYDFRRSDPGRKHPTQKPVNLMEWTMQTMKIPDDAIVLDPYMGSGTTGVACARTGRGFIGIEREPEYFEIACNRIEAELRQGRLF